MYLEGESLPLRERGLKSSKGASKKLETDVAPLAGAWIEIPAHAILPRSGRLVAPLAGAWIEISGKENGRGRRGSLPLRERGLKSGPGNHRGTSN